ncbi:MAG: M3 family oligoendopeptidase [Rhodospirillales bacterium]
MTTAQKPDTSAGLPVWNLADLYAGPDDPALEADLGAADADARVFREAYAGKLAGLDGAELGAAVQAYEAILEHAFKVISYAQLLHAADTADPEIARFHQSCQERVNDITGATLFFTLELNRIDDRAMAEKLDDPVLGRYRPWIEAERLMRPYQLGDDLEQLLHDKSVTGRSAWARLFDETMAELRFDFDGEELTLGEVLNRLTDSDPGEREKAGRSLSAGLKSRIRLFSLVTNTIAKDKEIEDTKRKFPRPFSSRNLANQVEDEVVDALAGAVTSSYGRLSHRYYTLKARWFGAGKLNWWDRNAPFPKTEERNFSWDQARETVLGAYAGFAPKMAETAASFFDKRWIDAEPRPGKNSGAFAHPVVPSAHPYVLMNFYGKPRDVMTLAHELGHGVHQVLAAPQGTLLADTPLTLAETASVFGEMLTFRAILDAESDAAKRRVLLAGKVEDMLNTVVRQIAFHCFETEVHDRRKSGELTADQLGDIWMKTQAESLGDAIELDDGYRTLWAYIPHFVHTPFYVYAYAFGDSLVNALYGLYQDGHPKFQDKYFEMLAAGGTLRHRDLLAPFGLDASDPAFWNLGLDVISGFIDELEKDLPA